MERAELAARLVEADNAERESLLREHSALADTELAYVLKDICLGAWNSEPVRAYGAAAALKSLGGLRDDPEVSALTSWAAGIAALVDGTMERALMHLDDAEARFLALGKPHTAASTQISKLYALAMLGRYDEAIECGMHAREVFIAHQDPLSAGKIEHNVGNIYWRRDRYQEAEHYLSAARGRFLAVNDHKQLAMTENCLAYVQSLQHNFRSAEQLYDQALKRAETAGLLITQAEIEASMGNMALFQGRYDRALDYLERSRRKYATLGMPHQSAIAEQEIADTYLELNLAPEAAAIYERVIPTVAKLGMRAEQARALAYYGRAAIMLGHMEKAHRLLAEARKLYAAEGNAVGEAMVTLTEAQLHHAEGDHAAASAAAQQAEGPLALAGTWRRLLLARWLRGETARAQGHTEEARRLLEATLRDAELQSQPQVAHRCLTSLGSVSVMAGDVESAEVYFKRAIDLIENLRAPLPAEEFRTAFFSDKLIPYDELVRLCLTDGSRNRAVEALGFVERARSRSLIELLGESANFRSQPRDTFEAHIMSRLEELREELNWFYSRINRPSQNATEMASLHTAVQERENATLDIMRQLHHRGGRTFAPDEPLDMAQLQHDLGSETALVEYTSLDGQLLAFVVTDTGVEVARHLGSEEEVTRVLEQLHFQMSALRYGAERVRKHLPHLTVRVRHHLHALYHLLLRPIEERVGKRRLVIVPHHALHYVPFHALYDGYGYVIEQREVCYAPSAVVLRHCLAQPQRPWQRAFCFSVWPTSRRPASATKSTRLRPSFLNLLCC